MTAFGHRRKRAELPTPVAFGQAAFPKLTHYPGAPAVVLWTAFLYALRLVADAPRRAGLVSPRMLHARTRAPSLDRPNEPDAATPTLSERTRAPESRTNPADAAPGPLALTPAPRTAHDPRQEAKQSEAEMSEHDSRDGGAVSGATRRGVLKGAAAAAGVAAGSGAIKGFPTVWAQNLKDVKLLHLGSSYSAIVDIARQASKDLRLHGRDAGLGRRRAGQPRRHPAQLARHRRPRVLGGPARLPARRDAAGRAEEDQALGPGRPDLHQGRVPGRPQGLDPGHPSLRGAVRAGRRRQGVRQVADRLPVAGPDHLQRRHAGPAAGPDQAADRALVGAVQSRVQGQGGAGRHPVDRHHGRRHGASRAAAT